MRTPAYWAKERGKPLAWQAGYGAFSVGVRDVEKVKAYIRDQESHHLRVTFQEEYLALLREFGIPFDEKYLWD